MANILDRFNKDVIGSKGGISDYSSKISSKGDFSRLDDLNVILSSWNNILLTPTRTYNWDAEYGCDLFKMIFEPCDNLTSEKIKDEIITKIQRYDDRATITDIQIVYLTNRKGFNLSIFVNYKGEESNFNLTIDETLFSIYMEAVD